VESPIPICCRDRRAHFTANLRIVTSLSLSNLLIGVCVLLDNVELVPLVEGDAKTCAFVLRKALQDVAHVMSLFNLLALAVDHYIVVCSPMQTFLQRSRRINAVILTLWEYCDVRSSDLSQLDFEIYTVSSRHRNFIHRFGST